MPDLRPVPRILPEAKPFWDGLRERRLRLQQCEACARQQVYPRLLCRFCQSRSLTWVDVEAAGAVYSYSVVHRAPTEFAADLPFVTAVVRLVSGPSLFTRLIHVEPSAVQVGMAVRAAWDALGDPPLLCFSPEDRTR